MTKETANTPTSTPPDGSPRTEPPNSDSQATNEAGPSSTVDRPSPALSPTPEPESEPDDLASSFVHIKLETSPEPQPEDPASSAIQFKLETPSASESDGPSSSELAINLDASSEPGPDNSSSGIIHIKLDTSAEPEPAPAPEVSDPASSTIHIRSDKSFEPSPDDPPNLPLRPTPPFQPRFPILKKWHRTTKSEFGALFHLIFLRHRGVCEEAAKQWIDPKLVEGPGWKEIVQFQKWVTRWAEKIEHTWLMSMVHKNSTVNSWEGLMGLMQQ
ncbi:hypothetical protein P154DRAFT_172609 [Amniculicola lignicola CBS 123094]|uniref:Uncharacterized protein n=1 Tax=Amniculicola lignicola CBS 123094 TaxID=1392246 RepID=A0A6A5WH73_9PLEO|nr:hypothetical protein P154DRAFT_172609 [Amniculicola lignicola CBS 123094]